MDQMGESARVSDESHPVGEDNNSTSAGEEAPSTSAASASAKLSQPRSHKKKIHFDDFGIRKIVENFFMTRKEKPTLKKIFRLAKADLNFPGQREDLRDILVNSLGCVLKPIKNKGDFLIQKPDVSPGAKYLRILKENDQLAVEKKPVTFIDETWIHDHDSVSCQQKKSDSSKGKNNHPGQHWTVVHAGGENGFVQGAELIFKCKSSKTDYRLMDASIFITWIKEQLLPNIPPNGIVVMDNAPYHCTLANKPPYSNDTKEAMHVWLSKNNIEFDEELPKKELFELITKNKPRRKEYVVDQLFKSHGQEVLRLPGCHWELNPLEYIWNLMNQRMADKTTDQSKRDTERLIKEAIQSISPEDWKSECNHVEMLREKFWQNDKLDEHEESELIPTLGGENSETNNNTSEDDDDD